MADHETFCKPAILLVNPALDDAQTLPRVNRLLVDGCLSRHSCSPPGCLDDARVKGSRCYDPISSPERDGAAQDESSFERSSPAMVTDCKMLDVNSNPQVTAPTTHQMLSPGKCKHRMRQGRSPDSRSGSPYSSDSLSSSSQSDRSASTTPKDTYSNETNENSSSSFDVGSDKEKSSPWSMANFDRVLHDAPKREHIRSRKYTGSKGGGGSQSDSGSSSQSRNKPAKKLHGWNVEVTVADSEASISSDSMGHAHFVQGKESFEGNEGKSRISNGTDTGIATANTSGQSAQYQSNFSMSSSSGVDTLQSLCKERKNLPGKSVGTHYHDIRNVNKTEELIKGSSGNASPHHQQQYHHRGKEESYTSDSVSMESERKRRRFNRTFVLLRHCGLLELTLQTASLMQQSSLMKQQLGSLRQQTEVLHNAIQGLSANQSSATFDSVTAQGILKNLRAIMNRHGGLPHTHQPVAAIQHTRRLAVKRTSSGETISRDSGNAQSSSALQNSGSST